MMVSRILVPLAVVLMSPRHTYLIPLSGPRFGDASVSCAQTCRMEVESKHASTPPASSTDSRSESESKLCILGIPENSAMFTLLLSLGCAQLKATGVVSRARARTRGRASAHLSQYMIWSYLKLFRETRGCFISIR